MAGAADLIPALLPAERACLETYRAYMARVYRDEFGITDAAVSDFVAEDWFFCDERHDTQYHEMRARLPRARRVLDLASGMGTTALRGLQTGLDVYGIEPDVEKIALARSRVNAGAAAHGWPRDWGRRFIRGVGETLPFDDGSFDVILSYQTLEHVQDPAAVIREMLRVVRPGGALHLRCPDYAGTFEGHYQLPWLPLLPRPLARAYLRLLGRPLAGFAGIHYVTKAGIGISVTDVEQERFGTRLRNKRLPGWRGAALPWRAFYYLKRLFRADLQINLWVSVTRTPSR
jgi:SAM-dependent methyltransferase